MILSKPIKTEVRNRPEVRKICGTASDIASELGFDAVQCAQVALSVSEIAENALRYAGNSTVTFRLSRNNKTLELIVCDKGPGIKNVKKALEYAKKIRKNNLIVVTGSIYVVGETK